MPSDLDTLYSKAVAEAYASAPSGDPVLSTLELRHPAFLDDLGNPTAIRLVRDYGIVLSDGPPPVYGWNFKLEDNAPLDPATTVTFVACMFDFKLPDQADSGAPAIDISIDGVAVLLMDQLDAAVTLRQPIALTYREFLQSDPSGPAFVLPDMKLQRVTSNLARVQGSAGFIDLFNQTFPYQVYRPQLYPTLLAA